jgi:hypothetical protein
MQRSYLGWFCSQDPGSSPGYLNTGAGYDCKAAEAHLACVHHGIGSHGAVTMAICGEAVQLERPGAACLTRWGTHGTR